MNICVYCASSSAVAAGYYDAARALGQQIAARGDILVYGGASVGLMGALATAVKGGGGRVIGIMPTGFRDKRITFEDADELLFTVDLRTRKAAMEARADAFFVLPGGFGTLEELAETLTLRQLGMLTKPIILLNIDGFYDPLIALFEHYYAQSFAKPWRDLYYVAGTVADAFAYLDSYTPAAAPSKWAWVRESESDA